MWRLPTPIFLSGKVSIVSIFWCLSTSLKNYHSEASEHLSQVARSGSALSPQEALAARDIQSRVNNIQASCAMEEDSAELDSVMSSSSEPNSDELDQPMIAEHACEGGTMSEDESD